MKAPNDEKASRVLDGGQHKGQWADMLEPLATAVRAAIVFVGHMLVAVVIASLFKAFEVYWGYLYATHEPMVADRLPLRYVLEIGELAVIVIFLVYGCIEAVRVFGGRHRRE